MAELDKHVFFHGYNCILEELFAQLCPNFISDPGVIICNLKQEYKEDGINDIVRMSVLKNFSTLKNLLSMLPKTGKWTINIHDLFINGLDHKICEAMELHGYWHHISGKVPLDV
eukprot:15366079-Ditylum_brightwellii.AAC.1